MMDFIYENQQRDLEQRIRQLERRYLATLREHPDTDDRAVNLAQIEAEHAELAQVKASIAAIDTPATDPEEQIEQAAQARAAEIVKQQKIEERAAEIVEGRVSVDVEAEATQLAASLLKQQAIQNRAAELMDAADTSTVEAIIASAKLLMSLSIVKPVIDESIEEEVDLPVETPPIIGPTELSEEDLEDYS